MIKKIILTTVALASMSFIIPAFAQADNANAPAGPAQNLAGNNVKHNSENSQPKPPTNIPPVNQGAVPVGVNTSGNKCPLTAGYTWSKIKGQCVRLSEVAMQLDPTKDTSSAKLSAFVIFPSDGKNNTVEAFLPHKDSILLNREKNNDWIWSGKGAKLMLYRCCYKLTDDNNNSYIKWMVK